MLCELATNYYLFMTGMSLFLFIFSAEELSTAIKGATKNSL